MRRADLRLERFAKSHAMHGALPKFKETQFEADTNSWLVTYKNNECDVIVITDRCHGDDIGAASGC